MGRVMVKRTENDTVIWIIVAPKKGHIGFRVAERYEMVVRVNEKGI